MRASDSPTGQPEGWLPRHDHYRIRVRGRLAGRWSAQFEGMRITSEHGGTTLIDGTLVDQAALHAVLHRVRDLGLDLLSVDRGPPD